MKVLTFNLFFFFFNQKKGNFIWLNEQVIWMATPGKNQGGCGEGAEINSGFVNSADTAEDN